MDLATLVAPIVAEPDPAWRTVQVRAVEHDSRRVGPGALYCCVPGRSVDGRRFAAEAVAAGAVAVLAEQPVSVAAPVVQVPAVRPAMARLASRLAGEPSQSMRLVGVTGTNGKTTTTAMVAAVLDEAGMRCEVLGTLSGARTTPESTELQPTLAGWRDDGVQAVAMEVSSHALDQHRVDGCRFAVAVFTNLSRDHLDYHPTMEAYFRAKARLFGPELTERAVVNLDDPYGRLLADAAEVPTDGFSLDEAERLQLTGAGATFELAGHRVELALPGRFNVANALAAAHVGTALGAGPDVVARGLSRTIRVPGRMQRIDAGQPFTVLVDYAHTPDGLDAVLRAADELAAGARVHVVFGCGGERDRSKRPEMGRVATASADVVVLTADNSRGEDTSEILDAIRGGATGERARSVAVEPDRRAAIATVLAGAAHGDVVVIAGKGHETTQIIGDAVTPFDDVVVAREEIDRLETVR